MALPPPPPPPSGGGGKKSSGGGKKSGGGGSSGGGRTTQPSTSSSPKYNPWVVWKNGKISFVNSVNPPANALLVFGLPAKKSDFLQAKSHYNDLFGAWLGRKPRAKEVASLLARGTSDYQLRIQLMRKPAFKHSAMYRTLQNQASQIVGFNYKPSRAELVRAARSEGGLSTASLQAVLANSGRAQKAVTKSFVKTSGADTQYYAGAFGPGRLNTKQVRALALQESGLKQTTLGAKLQKQLDEALVRMQRVFSGTLATPQLGLGPGGLQAQSLNPNPEPDLPA